MDLRALWRETRDARVLRASAREEPDPHGDIRTTTAAEAARRVQELASHGPDPHLTNALLRWGEQMPWTSKHGDPFWQAWRVALAEHAPRDFDPTVLAARMQTRTPTLYGVAQAEKLRRLAMSTPQVRDLTEAETTWLAQRLGASAAPPPALEALLQAVVEDPDDVEGLAVLADLLQEQGDPRGELISLQLGGGDQGRASELLREHGAVWTGPWLAALADVRFELGFPAHALLVRQLNKTAKLAGDPALRTLRSLAIDSVDDPDLARLAKVAASPTATALTQVRYLLPQDMAKVGKKRGHHIVSVGVDWAAGQRRSKPRPPFVEALASWTALQELEVRVRGPDDFDSLLEALQGVRVPTIRITTHPAIHIPLDDVQRALHPAVEVFRFETDTPSDKGRPWRVELDRVDEVVRFEGPTDLGSYATRPAGFRVEGLSEVVNLGLLAWTHLDLLMELGPLRTVIGWEPEHGPQLDRMPTLPAIGELVLPHGWYLVRYLPLLAGQPVDRIRCFGLDLVKGPEGRFDHAEVRDAYAGRMVLENTLAPILSTVSLPTDLSAADRKAWEQAAERAGLRVV